MTPISLRTQASSATARNATPSSSPTITAGASRSRTRQFTLRRYAVIANMSATISRTSSAPVDCLAGRIAAKIATEMVLAPGTAVLDTPTDTAATASRIHAHQASSGTSVPGRCEGGVGERGGTPLVLHPQRRDDGGHAELPDGRSPVRVLLGDEPRV